MKFQLDHLIANESYFVTLGTPSALELEDVGALLDDKNKRSALIKSFFGACRSEEDVSKIQDNEHRILT